MSPLFCSLVPKCPDLVNFNLISPQLKSNIMNQKAITYGVIGGLVSIAATLVMYIVNPALLASFWIMMLFIPVQIVFVVLGTIAARKNAGGYMPFGKAFLNAFVCGMVMSLLGVLFQILLFRP